jgi:hypothetical protein
VRRPLLPVEAAADAKPAVVLVVPAGKGKPEPVQDLKGHSSKERHGETASSEPAK